MTNAPRTLKVWDLPTRIFHWALALVVAVAWLTGEGDGFLFLVHRTLGVVLLGFIAFRLVWGVIGSRYALFNDFVYGFAVVKDYTRRLLCLRPPYSIGHNPLGGWMVIALMTSIVLASLSGLALQEDGYSGPLSTLFGHGGLADDVHGAFANLVIVLALAHVGGVLAHGIVSRENLPRAMITGEKAVPRDEGGEDIRPVGFVRPLTALAIGVFVAVYFLNL